MASFANVDRSDNVSSGVFSGHASLSITSPPCHRMSGSPSLRFSVCAFLAARRRARNAACELVAPCSFFGLTVNFMTGWRISGGRGFVHHSGMVAMRCPLPRSRPWTVHLRSLSDRTRLSREGAAHQQVLELTRIEAKVAGKPARKKTAKVFSHSRRFAF